MSGDGKPKCEGCEYSSQDAGSNQTSGTQASMLLLNFGLNGFSVQIFLKPAPATDAEDKKKDLKSKAELPVRGALDAAKSRSELAPPS